MEHIAEQLSRLGLIFYDPECKEWVIAEKYLSGDRSLLFEKVRAGQVRIPMGSTEKLGTGVNVQDRLIAEHHLDAPIQE